MRPRSLLGRTAITIALTLLVFMIISLGTAVYFIFIPMAQRSSDDFAAVIVSAAHSLESLPEGMHEELKKQLLYDHGLIVTEQEPTLPEKSFDVPYYLFFQRAVSRRAGHDLRIVESVEGPLVWVDVPAHGKIFRLGFDRKRVGTNPPLVLLTAIIGGALLTFLASFLVVRRVVKPLAGISAAVQEVGRGRSPPVLSEDGPLEIATLARAFNRMSADIQELSDNRTVIVAGISHDLRTPLTRLGLAVEMLDEDSNPDLVAGIRQNLEAMNSLIEQFLQFAKGIADQSTEQLSLWEVIESQTIDLRRAGAELRLHQNDPPCVYVADPVALKRVFANLLQNAVQYGAGAPIDVNLTCNDQEVSIEICDRGPGIPADQMEAVFRPFHRLETAREINTGGSGLGLAIAQQLAIKHDWTIELLPREGGGTVARVLLPTGQRQSCYPQGVTDATASIGATA